MIYNFTEATTNCGCQMVRPLFRVLGIYNFGSRFENHVVDARGHIIFLLQCNANRSFCPYKAHIRMKRTLGLLRNRNVFLARCSTTSNEAVVWDARVDGEKRPSMQLV